MRERLLLGALVVALFCVPAVAQKSVSARDELNYGVQAYREARYDAAIDHFTNAIALDPQLVVAHLYLATAFAQEYIPGAETKENLEMGKRAIDEYKRVLDLDPKSPPASNALKGIASIYFNMKRFDDSKQYHKLAIEKDPEDPEEHYALAVMDWSQAYQSRMSRKAELHLQPEEPLIGDPACAEVRTANDKIVEDGMSELANALKLRPDYDDAMAYMNLLYRERADIQCGDPDAYAADLKKADEWIDLTLSAKKVKAERARRSEQPESR